MTILRDRYSSFLFHGSIPSPEELGEVLSKALKKRPVSFLRELFQSTKGLDTSKIKSLTLSVTLKHRRLQRRIRITGVPPKISKMTHVIKRYKCRSSVQGIAMNLMMRNK